MGEIYEQAFVSGRVRHFSMIQTSSRQDKAWLRYMLTDRIVGGRGLRDTYSILSYNCIHYSNLELLDAP